MDSKTLFAALAVRIDQIVLDLSIAFYCIEHEYVYPLAQKQIFPAPVLIPKMFNKIHL